MFTNITGQETVALMQDLLTSNLAHALTSAGSAPPTHPQCRLEDLLEPAQFILQFADALQPVEVPTPIEDDPSSLGVNILHVPNNPIHSQLDLYFYTSFHIPFTNPYPPNIILTPSPSQPPSHRPCPMHLLG
jgi:hypothetical protein